MRQRSFARPYEKLRGVRRRLRALDRWSNSFAEYFPEDVSSERCWHCRIAVLDRLVNPPTTSRAIQRHAAGAMLKAAESILRAKPVASSDHIVEANLSFPEMFGSDLLVFRNEQQRTNFYDRNQNGVALTMIEGRMLSDRLDFSVPALLKETGWLYREEGTWDGEPYSFEEEWWSYTEQ
ncbi:DUF3916 domain-containing protein [Acaryochloris thomasi]|nr:DUF3916 domain-containing protein [Acaryochloris thomasi]